HAAARTYAGQILNQLGRPGEALPEFRLALDIDPGEARAWMGLGVALAWTRQPAEARRAFEETIRREPSNVEAHYDLGLVLEVLGENQEALREFDAALSINPQFGPAAAARAEAARDIIHP